MVKEINKNATAGNYGKGIRSDCAVKVELNDTDDIEIDTNSKVGSLYGSDIENLLWKGIKKLGIGSARIWIDDTGALPYVISARLEAAVKQIVDTNKEVLPEMLPENMYATAKDRNRFSRLYLPGNTPSLMINAGIHKPDGIILDLEDAVAPAKKDESRYLVRNALRVVNFYGAERMVRINQIPRGLDDLDFIVPHNVNLILVPKTENAEQIIAIEQRIAKLKRKHRIENPIWLMPIIESALGVINAYSIATSSENIVAMAIGLEDYTADLGVKRTNEGSESFMARCSVVSACKAAGIQPIDSVFSDVGDMEALKENVIKSKSLGFEGMGCIHPRQIRVIQHNFAPDEAEIDKAKKIVKAYYEAEAKGLGVVSLGTKMIDPPVVKRALKSIDLAITLNILSNNWREEDGI